MPIYEFKCSNCSIIFEQFVTLSHYSDKVKCPKCGSDEVKKQMSSFSSFTSGGNLGMGGSVPPMPSAGGGCGSGGFS
jgi:putative FmdB family regulatory protein